jgi:hypothetical protein
MDAKVTRRDESGVTIEVRVEFGPSMLESEKRIQDAVNALGCVATSEAMGQFDTDGDPIVVGGVRMTDKGVFPKEYQTPYGAVVVERHMYQPGGGGRTYCPLEDKGRILGSATPRFAMLLSHKYAEFGAGRVCEDLDVCHGRIIAKSFVQNTADMVAAVALAKEEDWSYAIPKVDSPVQSISIGLDGTCMLTCDDGWREAMVGTIALLDKNGERLHTTYVSATPEYGKETFLTRLEREITRTKAAFPHAVTVGVADGALGNWEFLKRHTQNQVLDFYHASEYLTKVADAVFKRKTTLGERAEWLESACHRLKHNHTAPNTLIAEMIGLRSKHIGDEGRAVIDTAVTYFKNNKKRMVYADHISRNLPIESGVTEAACKVLVKQRLCGSGMRWKEIGAASVLSLRTLTYTTGRWSQFWSKVGQYGYVDAA